MVVGYVRLSRDDDKRNYTSIENQRELIENYAVKHDFKIDNIYEDDGITGYTFDRPGFIEMMDNLNDIEIIIAKDLSRIGRNNAKVLLLLDKLKESGIRLILIDDNYDNFQTEDDMIGIKTWFNERYVKDTSRKIKKVISMKQENGELVVHAPFGYYIQDKQYKIRQNEADIVRRIFELYTNGHGYRSIANLFNEQNVDTPKTLMDKNKNITAYNISLSKWTDNKVRDILKNDTYIGNYRLRKRERKTIHGTDKRVPKDNQFVFKNHHEPIISEDTFNLAQELMQKRIKINFKGFRNGSQSLFSNVLICGDCGKKLTPIVRKTSSGERKYYICSGYNTNGINSCNKSHLVNEVDLIEYTCKYLDICKDNLSSLMENYDIEQYNKNQDDIKTKIISIESDIKTLKSKFKLILEMKLNDIAKCDGDISLINETYDKMQNDIMNKVASLEEDLTNLKEKENQGMSADKDNISFAYNILSSIKDKLEVKDIESIIDKIVVDSNSIPHFNLKYNINDYVKYNVADIINSEQEKMISDFFRIIAEEERDYTSVKYVLKKMNELGYKISKRSIMVYFNLAIYNKAIESTGDKIKPYNIVAKREDILKMK